MGALRADDPDSVLQPMAREDEMRYVESSMDLVPADGALMTLLRTKPEFGRTLGALFEHSNEAFDRAFPGATREVVDVAEWQEAGFDRVVEVAKLLNLKAF